MASLTAPAPSTPVPAVRRGPRVWPTPTCPGADEIDLARLLTRFDEALAQQAQQQNRDHVPWTYNNLWEVCRRLRSGDDFGVTHCTVQTAGWRGGQDAGGRGEGSLATFHGRYQGEAEEFLTWDGRLFGVRGEETPEQAQQALAVAAELANGGGGWEAEWKMHRVKFSRKPEIHPLLEQCLLEEIALFAAETLSMAAPQVSPLPRSRARL